MTHYDYLDQYLLTDFSRSAHTIKAYRSDLRQMRLHQVDWSVASLRRYFHWMKAHYKPSTILRRYHVLHRLGNVLVERRRIKKNPMVEIRPIVHQRLQDETYHDSEELIPVIRQIQDPTYRLFFEVISQTGLRFMEARLLTVQDFDLAKKELYVRHGKGGRTRTVPIGETLCDKIVLFLAGRTVGYLFQSVTGRMINEHAARKALREVGFTSLKRHVRPHMLRIAYATYLYQQAGLKLLDIKRLLGHASISTTEGYIRSQTNHVRDVLNRLSA
ncbi:MULTISPECIES: tyrosine-type recombinase/integrase [Exiguobacterium]|uniref:tyrosine-type recombinase/integrase n=1 Tax=Exiguobacterium TaxID=33986 RepID=UPI000493D1D6|nr:MULTISPECIES: tyrosine-type recombinase/integrase [Exiguobacterium]HCD57838.1 integrase [Exiguobacterium sp.]